MAQAIHATYDVPEALRWDAEVAKSFAEWAPYELGGLRPRISGRSIAVAGVPGAPLGEPVEAILARLAEATSRGFRDLAERVIESHASSRPPVTADPLAELLAAGDLVPAAPGDFIYRGRFLAALRRLDAVLHAKAVELGAVEESYPATLPASLLRRAGYLKSFPQHAMFVAPAAFDAASIAQVRSDVGPAASALASPERVLAPAPCYHTFMARIGEGAHPEQTVTTLHPCHRHEPLLEGHSLERLTNYRVRELVFFGTPEFVAGRLDACFAWFLAKLREWDVAFSATTANDAFFATESDSKRAFQTVLELKREVRLPVMDGRWTAAASFNNHRDSLVKAFEIEGGDGARLASGCIGFGTERLLYGLFCAFGMNLADWPRELAG